MAGDVKGLTIELEADASGVKKAFKDLKQDSKAVESQLRDVNRALKFDPSNTALLETKQRLLAQAVEKTAKQLDEAKKAQQAFIDGGGDLNSEAYNQLVIETERLAGHLSDLEGESDATAAALNDTGDAAEHAAEGAGEAAEGAEEAAGATGKWEVALGNLISKGLEKMASAAKNAVTASFDYADSVNTLANNYGLTQEAAYALYQNQELLDYSVSGVTRMMREQYSTLAESTEAYDQLGIRVRNASGELMSQEQIWISTIAYLRSIEDPVQRAAVGTELLGNKYYELGGILNSSKETFEAFGTELLQNDESLRENLQGLNDFKDAVATLKKVFMDVVISLGKFFGMLSRIKGLLPAIVIILGGLAAAYVAVNAATIAATLSQWGLNAAMLANPIGLIIIAVTALVALFILLAENMDAISAAFTQLWDECVAGVNAAVDAMRAAFDQIVAAITERWEAIKAKFAEAKEAGAKVVHDLLSGIQAKWNALVAWVTEQWNRLRSIFTLDVNMNFGGGVGVNGSHANGLDYVPFDGYIAELHKGERVLTAEENKAYSNGTGGGVTVVQNITAVQQTPVQLAATSEMYYKMARWV